MPCSATWTEPARDRGERPERRQARARDVGGVPRPGQGLCVGDAGGDRAALEAALARNVWRGAAPDGAAAALARVVLAQTAHLAEQPLAALTAATVRFPACGGGGAMIPELHRPMAVERVGPSGTGRDRGGQRRGMRRPGAADEPAGGAGADLRVSSGTRTCRRCCSPTATCRRAWCRPASSRWRISRPPSRSASLCAASRTAQESDDADPEALDEIPYADGMLDLGEAAAEQLALALDPYPRAPGAALPEIADEAEAHRPFAALASLRRRTDARSRTQ